MLGLLVGNHVPSEASGPGARGAAAHPCPCPGDHPGGPSARNPSLRLRRPRHQLATDALGVPARESPCHRGALITGLHQVILGIMGMIESPLRSHSHPDQPAVCPARGSPANSADASAVLAAALRQFLLGNLTWLSRWSTGPSAAHQPALHQQLVASGGGEPGPDDAHRRTEAMGGSGPLSAYIAELMIGNSSRLDRGALCIGLGWRHAGSCPHRGVLRPSHPGLRSGAHCGVVGPCRCLEPASAGAALVLN